MIFMSEEISTITITPNIDSTLIKTQEFKYKNSNQKTLDNTYTLMIVHMYLYI